MRRILDMLVVLACCVLHGKAGQLNSSASRELQKLSPEFEDGFMTMIVVIDSSGPDAVSLLSSWREFEENWPNRKFCILQVRGGRASDELLVPRPMKYTENVQTEIVNRDMNLRFRQSDWFNLCNLDEVTRAALMFDVKIQDVLSSYTYFMQRITTAGITLETVTPLKDKNYIKAMDRFFISSNYPSLLPSSSPSMTSVPSASPSEAPTKSSHPTNSAKPSSTPSLSLVPSLSNKPSLSPSAQPSITVQPTMIPSSTPSDAPSSQPSRGPSGRPSEAPSQRDLPSARPSLAPSLDPTAFPTTVEQLHTSLSFSFHVETAVAVTNDAFAAVMKAVSADLQRIVIGDIGPGVTTEKAGNDGRCQMPQFVDDLFVCYGIGNLAGYGSDTHGEAVAVVRIGLVRSYKNGNVTPVTGEILVDWGEMWATDLYQIGLTSFTSLLGVGTLWDEVVSSADGCQYPADTAAAKMFKDSSSCDELPMEDDCGSFRKDCFIETRWPGFDGVPMNPLTVAVLEDLGYEVDYKALDGQTTINPSCLCRKGRQATDPGQRQLRAEAKKNDENNDAIAGSKLNVQEGRPLAEFEVIDLSGKLQAVVYRDNGQYFTSIRKSNNQLHA